MLIVGGIELAARAHALLRVVHWRVMHGEGDRVKEG